MFHYRIEYLMLVLLDMSEIFMIQLQKKKNILTISSEHGNELVHGDFNEE